jgi:hypothetical protein
MAVPYWLAPSFTTRRPAIGPLRALTHPRLRARGIVVTQRQVLVIGHKPGRGSSMIQQAGHGV